MPGRRRQRPSLSRWLSWPRARAVVNAACTCWLAGALARDGLSPDDLALVVAVATLPATLLVARLLVVVVGTVLARDGVSHEDATAMAALLGATVGLSRWAQQSKPIARARRRRRAVAPGDLPPQHGGAA